jgi:hypothetical protein
MSVRAMKTFSSGDFYYVYGEVYAPLHVDTDGETMAAEVKDYYNTSVQAKGSNFCSQ